MNIRDLILTLTAVLYCLPASTLYAQSLSGNNGRFLLFEQDFTELYTLCGLEEGKSYHAQFISAAGIASEQKLNFQALNSCENISLPWSATEGTLSINCTDCEPSSPPQEFGNLTLTGTPNASIPYLIEGVLLPNPCYTTFNYSITGGIASAGTFNGGTALFGPGADEGVVLSTGFVSNLSGPSSNFSSNGTGGGSDPDLAALAAAGINDAIVLEFDLISSTPQFSLQYAMASEEYCDFAPPNTSGFSDVLGIFISGPDIGESVNLAVIPGTGDPVGILSINPVTNPEFFNPNGEDCEPGPYSSLMAFDGYTATFTAQTGITPGETYHIKIAIGDAGDSVWDSALFLLPNTGEGEQVPQYTAFLTTPANPNIVYETCDNIATLTFAKTGPLEQSVVIPLELSDITTAIEGVDFAPLPDSIIIPPFAASASLNIEIYADEESENSEVISFVGTACSGNLEDISIIIEELPELSVDATVTPDDLCASNNYDLAVSVTGGSPHYDIDWTVDNGSITGNNLSITADALLSLLVSDRCDSTYTETFELTFVNGEGPSADPTYTSECLEVTVSANATGSGNLSYEWSNGADTESVSFTISQDTDLSVTVTDECDDTVTESINIPFAEVSVPAPEVSLTSTYECGSSVVSLSSQVTGGTPPYAYAWSTGGDEASTEISPSETTEVTLSLTDACDVEIIETLSVSPSGANILTYNSESQCVLPSEFPVDLEFSVTGTAPFLLTYTLNSGEEVSFTAEENDFSLAATEPGFYRIVRVEQSSGSCTEYSDNGVSLEENNLSITGQTSYDNCSPTGGSISFTVSGQEGALSYVWEPEIVNPTQPSGLSPGVYTLSVTDAGNDCGITESFTVTGAYAPLEITGLQITQSSACADGRAEVLYDAGGQDVEILWSNGESTTEATSLPYGSVSVTITNENDCSVSTSAVIPQILPDFSFEADCAPDFFGTSDAMVTYNGILAPFTSVQVVNAEEEVVLTLEDLTPDYGEESASLLLSELPVGTYEITATDDCGTSTVNELSIIYQADLPEVVITQGICEEGGTGDFILEQSDLWEVPFWPTIDVNAWSISNAPEGIYPYTLVDIQGCTAEGEVNLQVLPAIEITADISPLSNVNTNDGAIDLTISDIAAPYSYAWSNGSTEEDISGLAPGEYTLSLSDANGCLTVQSWVIVPFDCAFGTESIEVVGVTCEGDADGSIGISLIDGTDPITYAWSNGAVTAETTGLEAGVYSVTATDGQGCSVIESIEVPGPDYILSIDEVIVTDSALCLDGAASLTYTSSLTLGQIVWSSGETGESASMLPGGDNTVSVENELGCIITEDFTVEQIVPEFTLNVFCPDVEIFISDVIPSELIGSLISQADPSNTFTLEEDAVVSFEGNSVTVLFSNLVADTYDYTFDIGCQPSFTGSFTVNDPADLPEILNSEGVCPDSDNGFLGFVENEEWQVPYWPDLDVTAWTLENLAAGTYNYVLTDINFCQTEGSLSLTTLAEITLSSDIIPPTGEATNDAEINLTVEGGLEPFTYMWSNEATGEDLNNLAEGQYTVTVTDANGCTSEQTFFVPAFDCALGIEEPLVQQITCFGDADGSISISVNNGTEPYSYSWSNGAQESTIENLGPGSYTLTVTDADNCPFLTEAFTLSEPDEVVVEIEPGDTTLCFGQDFTLTATGDYPTYNWSEGSSGSELAIAGPGTYSVTASDANGCADSAEVNINFYPEIEIPELTGALVSFQDSTETYAVELPAGLSIEWSVPQGGELTGNANEPTTEVLWTAEGVGILSLSISDENGCESVTNFNIIIDVIDNLDHVESTNLSVYPNPFGSSLVVKSTDNRIADIQLLNVLGQKVKENLKLQNGYLEINTRELPSGVFLIRCTDVTGNLLAVEKVVKE